MISMDTALRVARSMSRLRLDEPMVPRRSLAIALEMLDAEQGGHEPEDIPDPPPLSGVRRRRRQAELDWGPK